MKGKLIVVLLSIMFFVASLVRLNDYGINWDEPIHFHRGQSYLHLLLTGETRFPQETDNPRVSYYETNSLNAEWFLENGGGHPPMNDILAAVSNKIFYQKLNWMSDVHSYHLFNIAVSTLLVFVVGLFALEVLGKLGSIVAMISLSLYPLFWAESKFNIKDPAESSFIALTLYAFWKSLELKNWKWLVLAVLSFTLGLGTKFNILFLPMFVLPYLIVRYWHEFSPKRIAKFLKSFGWKYWTVIVISPVIIIGLFVLLWPFLWADPISNFLEVVGYYKDIGTGVTSQPDYLLPLNLNGFPLYWIVTTTYPYVLLLTLAGIIWSLKEIKLRRYVPILWLTWLIIPIARVTAPETTLYGGVRQLMEYIPAMALLAGAGATYIVSFFKKHSLFISLVILLPFVHLFLVLVRLHPNENVYFNSLIGGLSGAAEKNVPYYGNSFGNAYWPLIQWMNENAEPNARLALVQGTALNIPDVMLRDDITRWNVFWSGIDRKGEYLIELTHNDYKIAYPYAWDYIENYLEPVAVVEVDGVPLAKLWKNDIEHTKKGYDVTEQDVTTFDVISNEGSITVKLDTTYEVSRIIMEFNNNGKCSSVAGSFYTGTDEQSLTREIEHVPTQQISDVDPVNNGVLTYFFAGKEIQYIQFVPDTVDSCIYNLQTIRVKVLQ